MIWRDQQYICNHDIVSKTQTTLIIAHIPNSVVTEYRCFRDQPQYPQSDSFF